MAGIIKPKDLILDGTSMLPNLSQGPGAETIRNEMYWEFRGDFAARIGKWKWIDSDRGSGLFDLEQDLSERSDLSTQYPDTLRMVRAKFVAWQEEMARSEARGPFKNF